MRPISKTNRTTLWEGCASRIDQLAVSNAVPGRWPTTRTTRLFRETL